MDDSFSRFCAFLRKNYAMLSGALIVAFLSISVGVSAHDAITVQGDRLAKVEARADANSLAISAMKQQGDDIQETVHRIEDRVDGWAHK